jgi:hypothetical protein
VYAINKERRRVRQKRKGGIRIWRKRRRKMLMRV